MFLPKTKSSRLRSFTDCTKNVSGYIYSRESDTSCITSPVTLSLVSDCVRAFPSGAVTTGGGDAGYSNGSQLQRICSAAHLLLTQENKSSWRISNKSTAIAPK